jgi:hypothetical protein
LDGLRNVQDLLDREKSRDTNILSIEAFDQNGSVVFSTDRTFIGDLIANRWLAAWKQADKELWYVQEEDALVVGGPLVNSFDAVIGGIALRYSRSFLDKVLGNTAIVLLQVCGILIVLGAVGSMVGTYLFFRPVSRDLDLLAREFEQASGGTEIDAAGIDVAPGASPEMPGQGGKFLSDRDSVRPLMAETRQFTDRVREARMTIEKTSEEIRQLDELN